MASRKATGMVRKIDSLGRIVIPRELRTVYGLQQDDAVEMFITENNCIVLKKYDGTKSCALCGTEEPAEYMVIHDKPVCTTCINKIKQI